MNVTLDACVLYPAPVRDLLLNLADLNLFRPKWSKKIHEEWISNLLRNRTDLHRSQLERTMKLMEEAFPDANVKRFENIIQSLSLPDEKDRHILAVAIKSKSEFIVTFNLKDFPDELLLPFNVEAIHPDEFVCNLLDSKEIMVNLAFNNHLNSLRNPPTSKKELLATLKILGMIKSTQRINSSN